MRHGATLIGALEGLVRPAFRIARELALNSRSGLTVRFLSKKLDLPEEEVEYLVDVNHRLFFWDMTKVKLVAEGATAVKRIAEGLENHGDIPSVLRLMKGLEPSDLRRLEEFLHLDRPGGRKSLFEEMVSRCYIHPDALVEYVAEGPFSATTREIFDIIWQSPEGVMPVSLVRAAHGGTEYVVEEALLELFRGFALFEMFRFDAEDRLVRVVGLLSEIRQWRETTAREHAKTTEIKPLRGKPSSIDSRALELSEQVCRLVAAVAAKPARIRGDGDLFREDRRRLSEVCPDNAEAALNTGMWIAQGVGWLARVDNEIRAGELDPLLGLDRLNRHRILFDWLTTSANEAGSRGVLMTLLDEIHPGAWYSVVGFIRHAMQVRAEDEQPVLKNAGGHWHYVSPSVAAGSERALARSLEETFLWLGVVDRADVDGDSAFRLTDLGLWLLTGKGEEKLLGLFPAGRAEIVVQPNFDIVVPSQAVDPLLTVPLDRFAQRESTGQATVYHLTKESFTRAVQEGHDGDVFVRFLLDHNRGGALPANVMTTLDDWRGGMKRVRLRTLSVLESDDPLVVADLLHRRRFKKYFQAVDPRKTIVYSKIGKSDLAKELEKEGFVVE